MNNVLYEYCSAKRCDEVEKGKRKDLRFAEQRSRSSVLRRVRSRTGRFPDCARLSLKQAFLFRPSSRAASLVLSPKMAAPLSDDMKSAVADKEQGNEAFKSGDWGK